jgi:S-adenosylmethionine:tRNA ribosyltransferase-isomerase
MNLNEVKKVRISDFDYELPAEYIAQKPLDRRDSSKLLVYKQGDISHYQFSDILDVLPPKSRLVFNNTRVIPARIFATKETGARIQIFLLNPVAPFAEVERSLKSKEDVVWQCMIGNAKRFKEGDQLQIETDDCKIKLTLVNKESRHVAFSWNTSHEFCDVLESIGKMPLPPYIKREAQEEDDERYQTVFAKEEGAVAAPTAGLHFTEAIMDRFESKGIAKSELTLHVGAGTFKPVEVDEVWDHPMHEEFFQVSIGSLRELAGQETRIATGTTSLRSLESLYWVGVKLHYGEDKPFEIEQHFPYECEHPELSFESAIQTIIDHLEAKGQSLVTGSSGIMIMPGYRIKSVHGLITNFHLPKSTLLLLISALVGNDWKKIYSEAKAKNYRFLSYGDSSLLMT